MKIIETSKTISVYTIDLDESDMISLYDNFGVERPKHEQIKTEKETETRIYNFPLKP